MKGVDDLQHIMRSFISLLLVLTWPWTISTGRNRTERDVACTDGQEYAHGDICCLNCPAGKYVAQHCSAPYQKGVCTPCDFDTYTEHGNGLERCFDCIKCRQDQELVEQCTNMRNTQCQCKPGTFCLPDQACEVCKICSTCKEDEEQIECCSSNSNTVCRKRDHNRSPAGLPDPGERNKPKTGDQLKSAVVSVCVVAVILVAIFIFVYWSTSAGCKTSAVTWWNGMKQTRIESSRDSEETRQNILNGDLENGDLDSGGQTEPFMCLTDLVGEDRRLGLEEACRNSSPQQHNQENEVLRRLFPVNGEESLKKSFDLFGEIDVHYHNRFFRHIGLSDNAIRNADGSLAEDRVYELLSVWMEKEGMRADFNILIDALLYLNQRMSAENIISRAIANGFFTYED